MDIPDGYSDIPSGKTVSVVTHLQMFQRPPARAERSEASWGLRKVDVPDPGWYRSLFRRIGENWLWFSRLQMNDDELRGVLSGPLCETYVFEVQGRDEGLVELDFSAEGECELSFFGLTPPMVGHGAGRWMMNRALELAWSRSDPQAVVAHVLSRSSWCAGILHPVGVRALPQADRGCR